MVHRDTENVVNRREGTFALATILGAQPAAKGKAPATRASVYEAHHQNVANAMGHFRDMDHKITKVDNYDYNKSPNEEAKRAAGAGMLMRSVIKHRSGANKLKTTVRTSFNMEGGDHSCQMVTGPDMDKDAASKKASPSDEGGEE